MTDQKIEFYKNGNLKTASGYAADDIVKIQNSANKYKIQNMVLKFCLTTLTTLTFFFMYKEVGVTQINPKQFIKQKIIDFLHNPVAFKQNKNF